MSDCGNERDVKRVTDAIMQREVGERWDWGSCGGRPFPYTFANWQARAWSTSRWQKRFTDFVNDTQFPMRIQVGQPMLNNRGPGLCCAVVCHDPRHGLKVSIAILMAIVMS